jgi:hypothetical protein
MFISSQPPGLHQFFSPSQLKELPEKQLFLHKAAVAVFCIVRLKTYDRCSFRIEEFIRCEYLFGAQSHQSTAI